MYINENEDFCPRIALFIASEKGYEILLAAMNLDINIGFVVGFQEYNVSQSFSNDIIECASSKGIHYIDWEHAKNKLNDNIINHKVTHCIAAGWKYLIPKSINDLLFHPLIIFHDSILPKYRGFCPTPTALLKGENKIGMTVLFASEQPDQGPIIFQKQVEISDICTIQEAIHIQCELYRQSLKKLRPLLTHKEISSTPQDESKATYSIWREPDDCLIDWNEDSKSIFNLVRAVSHPYSGAYSFLDNKKIYIWQVKCCENLQFEIRNTGKIWQIDSEGRPIIVCGNGLIQIMNATYEDGTIVKFKSTRKRLG
ncbi:methionyl-tRNA formyltransferase [Silvanigrella aquatica]|uniref:Methionyl-tRNA formyltransferase n=1 Tax=Silvanigrella aquatica TaxID=1915309 RepID=A0A1L4D319_9BACT|nr:formyltransferase family protein [Silvanigrella aquatica]APJ04589.1 hypothetical protein AXG55_12000 [Silvanigrella aquatica]